MEKNTKLICVTFIENVQIIPSSSSRLLLPVLESTICWTVQLELSLATIVTNVCFYTLTVGRAGCRINWLTPKLQLHLPTETELRKSILLISIILNSPKLSLLPWTWTGPRCWTCSPPTATITITVTSHHPPLTASSHCCLLCCPDSFRARHRGRCYHRLDSDIISFHQQWDFTVTNYSIYSSSLLNILNWRICPRSWF